MSKMRNVAKRGGYNPRKRRGCFGGNSKKRTRQDSERDEQKSSEIKIENVGIREEVNHLFHETIVTDWLIFI